MIDAAPAPPSTAPAPERRAPGRPAPATPRPARTLRSRAASGASAVLAVGVAVLLLPPAASAQDPRPAGSGAATPPERYSDWTSPGFPPGEYARRRAAVAARLAESGGGVLLVPGAHGLSHGETFRQRDEFLYLTGLEVPRSALVLDPEGQATLFVPRVDPRFEREGRPNDFPGRPLAGDPALSRISGIEGVEPYGTLEAWLAGWERQGRVLRFDPGRPGTIRPVETSLIPDWDPRLLSLHHLQSAFPRLRIRSAHDELTRVRMVKSEAEIEVLRRAAAITSEAIRRAAAQLEDGVTERALEGVFQAACKEAGAQRTAFAPIVKSGPNSLWPWRILAAHYDRRSRAMRDGELVIFDVGCELDHYASDVGRTFPVSGRFTDEQRRLLEAEIAVADAIIAAVRPGVTFMDLQAVADSAIPPDMRPHMQTPSFFGHHIGLSAADPALLEVPLEPGMVFTVEPWYYDHGREVAVFTEDEVLVTEDGAEVLTRGLPRSPAELEALVGAADRGPGPR